MTQDTRRLIVDYLRRVPWWAWPLVGAVHGQMTWFYLMGVNSGLRNLGAAGSYMLVALLENRAWLRMVSSLPLARENIWRAQWWIGIGSPGLMLTALDLLIVLGVWLFAHPKVDLWHIALWMTNTWAALGVLLPLTGSLFGISEKFRWMPVIILPVYAFVLANGWPTDGPWLVTTLAVMVLGLAGAIATWVQPQRLAPMSPAAARGVPGKAARIPASTLSGWAVLAAMHGRVVLVFSCLLGASIAAMRLAWEGVLPGNALFGLVFFASMMASFLPSTALPISAARTFRSLPLSTNRLTAIAELGSLVPAALLLFGGLAAGGTSASELLFWLPVLSMMLSLQTLTVPIRLRLGEIRGFLVIFVSIMLQVLVMTLVMIGSALEQEQPRWFAPILQRPSGFVLSIIIAAAGFLWTRHELCARRNAYLPASPSPLMPAPFSGGPGTLPG